MPGKDRAVRSQLDGPRIWLASAAICDCLTQSGGLTDLNGSQAAFDNTSIAANQKLDARDAYWQVAEATNNVVRVAGGSGICWSGGEIRGTFAPDTLWATMHDKYGLIVPTPGAIGVRMHSLRVFNYGDGISIDTVSNTSNWEICGVYIHYSRDDGIENDFYHSGVIRDTFIDGCYDGVSCREYAAPPDGSANVVEVRNSLIRLQGTDQAFSGTLPNHNAFWKWHANAPKLLLDNVVFRADSPSQEGNGAGMYMAPPPGKLISATNCTMCWLGNGSFPESLPSGFTLLTGATALSFWNDKASAWLSTHPPLLPDTFAPIVSIFTPIASATLTGITTLRATAVDDVAVVGVQLKVDGNAVGAEQIVPTEYKPASDVAWDLTTKYEISWDSSSVSNGAHTISATARDVAGNSRTSATVAVTVSN